MFLSGAEMERTARPRDLPQQLMRPLLLIAGAPLIKLIESMNTMRKDESLVGGALGTVPVSSSRVVRQILFNFPPCFLGVKI